MRSKAFLWYGNSEEIWKRIVTSAWVTRAVAITTLVIRTAVDFQAAIGSEILASLVLECKQGLPLDQAAKISPMRASGTGSWSFAWFAIGNTWGAGFHHHRQYGLLAIAVCLLLMTTLLQFSSTLLLSDLKAGSLEGHGFVSQVRSLGSRTMHVGL